MSFGPQLDSILPIYEIPEDDLVGEVLIPAMQQCHQARIGAGFFSSRCLSQIAPGLASFINDTNGILYLLASPVIDDSDARAIRDGVRDPVHVLDMAMTNLFERARLSASAVARHAVDTLAYLIASDRLRMRVALMNQGMYHSKVWLLRSDDQWLAVHGSGNATERGLLVNGEQMSVERSWRDGKRAQNRVERLLAQWTSRWENRRASSLTLEVSRALDLLRSHRPEATPTVSDFWEAWQEDSQAGLELSPLRDHITASEYRPPRLDIPPALQWQSGRYAHQKDAVEALTTRGGGIVAMATGGGKTKTALIAATMLQAQTQGHMCIVVVAPTKPLIDQWEDELRAFGIIPIRLSGMRPAKRHRVLESTATGFLGVIPHTEALLMTNALFAQTTSDVKTWLETLPSSITRILVADEVHRLGTSSFLNNPPDYFDHRIGLSATPVRQYDPDGTHNLFSFFHGGVVYEFSLRGAIAAGCLVPYRYHIHPVVFSECEMERYDDLSEELQYLGFYMDDDGRRLSLSPRVEKLLRDRRALVEQADAKLEALRTALTETGPRQVARTLIYTSAKAIPEGKCRQITAVNRMLQDLGISLHQFTAEETAAPAQAEHILRNFGAGHYQVLTAMRVLDEGVDIPQTDTAYLLASSAVEREWVQRRGRILRNAPGKSVADLHDFVVMPSPGALYGDSLLRSELRRATEFAHLSVNEHDPDGPAIILRRTEGYLQNIQSTAQGLTDAQPSERRQ